MRKALIPAFVIALASAGAIAAEDAGKLFVQLDTDKDGFVSKAEAEKHKDLSAAFAKADANADGKLDPNEFSAALATLPTKK